jgi:hypothetical protein
MRILKIRMAGLLVGRSASSSKPAKLLVLLVKNKGRSGAGAGSRNWNARSYRRGVRSHTTL